MVYTIRNGCGDDWEYMTFDSKETADQFIGLNIVGQAYVNGGWVYYSDEKPEQVPSVVDSKLLNSLLDRIWPDDEEEELDDSEVEEAYYEFLDEHGFMDAEDEIEQEDKDA